MCLPTGSDVNHDDRLCLLTSHLLNSWRSNYKATRVPPDCSNLLEFYSRVYPVMSAVVVSRLMYASPAWRGFATATDLKRVDAFLRRCKRCGYCSSDLPDFEELLDESDDRSFSKTLNNSTHTLHTLLPPQSTASQHYHLRRRTHDRQLPTQISHLCTKNFVTRALYKDCY